jgi:hypothetical protein
MKGCLPYYSIILSWENQVKRKRGTIMSKGKYELNKTMRKIGATNIGLLAEGNPNYNDDINNIVITNVYDGCVNFRELCFDAMLLGIRYGMKIQKNRDKEKGGVLA